MNSGHKSYVFLKAGKFHIKSYFKYELFQGNPNLFLSVQHEKQLNVEIIIWAEIFTGKFRNNSYYKSIQRIEKTKFLLIIPSCDDTPRKYHSLF